MPHSSIDPVLARNLRTALQVRGKSAYAVAKALGRTSTWLYKIINEETGIMIPALREAAEELGVSVGSLLDPGAVPSSFLPAGQMPQDSAPRQSDAPGE